MLSRLSSLQLRNCAQHLGSLQRLIDVAPALITMRLEFVYIYTNPPHPRWPTIGRLRCPTTQGGHGLARAELGASQCLARHFSARLGLARCPSFHENGLGPSFAEIRSGSGWLARWTLLVTNRWAPW